MAYRYLTKDVLSGIHLLWYVHLQVQIYVRLHNIDDKYHHHSLKYDS